jgi:hypothetical protein
VETSEEEKKKVEDRKKTNYIFQYFTEIEIEN